MGLLQERREVPGWNKTTYAGQAAEDLRALLRRHGITNRDLAQACGKSEFWVGKRVNGQVPMDLDDLEVVARALGVSPAELLPHEWMAPSPVPPTGGDAVWAPRGSNPQPADYKFHSLRLPVTHSSEVGQPRPLLPRRPAEPRRDYVVEGNTVAETEAA